MASSIPLATLLVLSSALCLICLAESHHVLYSGETLQEGQSLDEGFYSFIMQSDCNLVLYKCGEPIWASNTGGLARSCRCDLQKDGNLVVSAPSNRVIWSSGSNGPKGNYVLVMQKDGNVVIYGSSIWATGTNNKMGYLIAAIPASSTAGGAVISEVAK